MFTHSSKFKLLVKAREFPIAALREVTLLLGTWHPNVVHMREVVVGSMLDEIYMVMEYAEHDLRSNLERMRHPYSQSKVKSIMHQVLDGISHLHASWIIHRSTLKRRTFKQQMVRLSKSAISGLPDASETLPDV
jgi:cell division cycle 2-like